jgi:ABC-2 type transport system ATP-binding protein
MPVIDARDLSMHFGPVLALDRVSFEVREREILGLLGPNGAGKTTAMRILTTYLVPTEGSANVAGFNIIREPLEVRKRIGYLPETAPLYPDMEVAEYLDFVGRGRGLKGKEVKARVDYVVGACRLASVYRRPILELSKGYRQRVGVAQALIHDPPLLILDEPTSGLDPLQITEMRELLRSLVHSGKTIIYSTHILQEVERMSDRVVMIKDGKKVADGTIPDLQAKSTRGKSVVLRVDKVDEAVERELQEMKARVTREDGAIKAEFAGARGSEIFDAVKAKGWPVREIREEAPSMEDLFAELSGRNLKS